MLRVLIDVDGVVADFQGLYTSLARHRFELSADADTYIDKYWDVGDSLGLTQAQKDTIEKCLNEPGVAANMDPFPSAIEAIKRLDEKYDVFFVTSHKRESPTWVFERENWLIHHFGNTLGGKVVSTHYKYLVVGDVLIDDKKGHIDRWAMSMNSLGRTVLPICFAYRHNRECKHLRLSTWSTIESTVSRWAGIQTGLSYTKGDPT